MKITAQDVEFVNWDKVRESFMDSCRLELVKVCDQAMAELSLLQPGQRKTFHIKVGSITISKPKE